MANSLENCTFGEQLNFSECHKLSYNRSCGLINFNDLSDQERTLLTARTGIKIENPASATICYHHKKVFLDRFEKQQTTCFDPLQCHKKPVKSHLRALTTEDCNIFSQTLKRTTFTPGLKLCFRCYDSLNHSEQELVESDSEFVPLEVNRESINAAATQLGVSPLKLAKLGTKEKVSYGKRKVAQLTEASKQKIASSLEVPESDLEEEEQMHRECHGCTDMDRLVEALKSKMSVSNRKTKIQLLTLAPQSWTADRCVKEFDVNRYMVKIARKLRKERGILPDINSHGARPIDEETVKLVQDFYKDDVISRILPGAKDYVSVRVNDQREHRQKRLILMNLNELYSLFKNKYSEVKLGLSKFCQLRPRECITVGARGTHSVCVCTIHQNVKLMLTALPSPVKLTYHDLMQKLVCNVESKQCMVHRCNACPGKDGLMEYLQELCDNSDENVHYKQWESTDRTTLVEHVQDLTEYLEVLVQKTDILSTHHFIAKSQSAYLSKLKENLPEDECIILLDFAENFSFVIQDAAQGFHWDNSQATLHPFVAYFRHSQTRELQVKSYCVISDHLKHDTSVVHTFQTKVIPAVKVACPMLKKIIYFSDGAASQYKNFKNFTNLCYHEEDFGVQAEWHFFATSHGKSACDGVGGTVKREAAKRSLQATITGHILTPMDLYSWASDSLQGIDFLYCTKEEVTLHAEVLKNRFEQAHTVSGTRDNHCYIPIGLGTLRISRVSGDNSFFNAKVSDTAAMDDEDTQIASPASRAKTKEPVPEYQAGQYIACLYDGHWWLGSIMDKDYDEDDLKVTFMQPRGPAPTFSWPRREDICWVPTAHVLCAVDIRTATGRNYTIDSETVQKITQRYNDKLQ